MKDKKCPYCGKRIPYTTLFHIKKRGVYCCSRCKKESKIKISNNLIISFIALCLAVILFMIIWINVLNQANNFLGVILVALAIIIYYSITPVFLNFVPLKKYAGTENSQKENAAEESYNGGYTFNQEAFMEAKKRKQVTPTNAENRIDNIIESIEKSPVVPIIENFSESHASSSNEPLKRVNRTRTATQSYVPEPIEEDVKVAPQRKKDKPDGSKYTANRRF